MLWACSYPPCVATAYVALGPPHWNPHCFPSAAAAGAPAADRAPAAAAGAAVGIADWCRWRRASRSGWLALLLLLLLLLCFARSGVPRWRAAMRRQGPQTGSRWCGGRPLGCDDLSVKLQSRGFETCSLVGVLEVQVGS